jgi:acetamidase/formamidase
MKKFLVLVALVSILIVAVGVALTTAFASQGAKIAQTGSPTAGSAQISSPAIYGKSEERWDALGEIHILPSVVNVTAGPSYFDNNETPVMYVEPGDLLLVETSYHHLDRNMPGVTIDQILVWHSQDKSRSYNYTYAWPGGPNKEESHHTLTGPIYVNGAMPGDVLEITYIKFDIKPYGFQEMLPGAPVLPSEAGNGSIWWYFLNTTSRTAEVAPGVVIPFRPHPGIVGVALPEPGHYAGAVPGKHGGNIDSPDITEGTIEYIPVWVKGALLKVGDFHVAMGYGEATTSALEGAAWILMKIDLRKGLNLTQPMLSTPTHWIVWGMDLDLDNAMKKAVKNAIDFIAWNYGLDRRTAYAVTSMAVDFVINEACNVNLSVQANIPKSIFVGYPERNTLTLPAKPLIPYEQISPDSFIK